MTIQKHIEEKIQQTTECLHEKEEIEVWSQRRQHVIDLNYGNNVNEQINISLTNN